MNVLDSPLEALAFNYVSFGIFTLVNNLWTWIAVITAAVSFWRIRAAGTTARSILSKPQPTPCIERETAPSPPISELSPPELAEELPASFPAKAKASCQSAFESSVDGLTKGKFTVCYDDECDGEGELSEVEELCYDGDGGCGEWWESWERMLRMRMGEMDWYTYQDLTAINGNVVRLWDEHRKLKYS